MTPITHDSWEWKDVQEQIRKATAELAKLTAELAVLRTQKDEQHGQNQERIAAIQERIEQVEFLINGDGTDDNPGLSKQVDRMVTIGKASLKMLAAIGIILGLIFAGGTMYIAYFEAHHHVTENSPAGVHSENHPQDAGIPTQP